MKEEYRDIEGYQEYKVSNLGNVKSLKFGKERILKGGVDTGGYRNVSIFSNNGEQKALRIHKLVAIAFLGHKPCGYTLVINHINFNKKDNRVENLEVVTQRENANKKHVKTSSKYTGVCWGKREGKWIARIWHNDKQNHLGYFECELAASKAYNDKLKTIL